MHRTLYPAITVLIGALAACSRGDPSPARVTARTDTLPGGVVRITSDQPVGWNAPGRAWNVARVLTIQGDDGTPAELVEPGSIAIDDFGRIYVVDRKPAVVKVFDSAGSLVRTIGGEGSGPGEFRTAFIAVHRADVVVHDPQQSRTSVFDTAGVFRTSWVSSCCMWMDIGIDTAGLIYIPTAVPREAGPDSRGVGYVRYRPDGSISDTLFVPTREDESPQWVFAGKGPSGKGEAMMSTTVPFVPRHVWAFDPAGGFVTGWSGDYRIAFNPRGTDTSRIVVRSWTPDEIPEPLRREQVESMVKATKDMVGETAARAIARLGDVPARAPSFTTLRVDLDGNLWARHLIGSDSTRTRYSVFGKDGSWLGELTLPVAVPEWGGQLFARGAVYTTTEGDDGRPAIAMLRVTRR